MRIISKNFNFLMIIFFYLLLTSTSSSNQEQVFAEYKKFTSKAKDYVDIESLKAYFTINQNNQFDNIMRSMKSQGKSDVEIEDIQKKFVTRGARFIEISDHAQKVISDNNICLVVRGIYHNREWINAIFNYKYEAGEYKIDNVMLDFDGGEQFRINASLTLCDLLEK